MLVLKLAFKFIIPTAKSKFKITEEKIMTKLQNLTSRLARTIIIEQQTKISDEGGGYEIKWLPFAKVKAEIIALGDYRANQGEFYQSWQLLSYGFYKFTIRYKDGISNQMRIKYQNRFYNIKRVINFLEKNKAIILIAEEGASV